VPEGNDSFGYRLEVGDFNDDGFDDLVVAAIREGWSVDPDAGCVHVFYGSADGPRTDNDQRFVAEVGGLAGNRGLGDFLGEALAVGDFDDDGYDDLAFAAPSRDVNGVDRAGQVHVVFGTPGGLTVAGQQLLDDGDFGGTIEDGDLFGLALAAGNFDQSGASCWSLPCYDDLAIGVPGQTVLGHVDAGKVLVAPGGAAGVQTTGVEILNQLNQAGTPGDYEYFGQGLAAGQLDHSRNAFAGYDDLAVGVPGEAEAAGWSQGAVYLFFGSAAGIDGSQQESVLSQQPGFKSYPPANSDYFGTVLAIADLDDDGWGDLIAGIPEKDGTHEDAGAVQLLYGALFADGFECSGSDNW
jgi:hypothetical protein